MPAEALRDLLEAAPRANIAFRSGDAIQATPVAFRFRAGRYWIGVPRTPPGPVPGPSEVVKLLIDDGRWFFELRSPVGPRAHRDGGPGARRRSVVACLVGAHPDKVVAWDCGTLREVADDGWFLTMPRCGGSSSGR